MLFTGGVWSVIKGNLVGEAGESAFQDVLCMEYSIFLEELEPGLGDVSQTTTQNTAVSSVGCGENLTTYE